MSDLNIKNYLGIDWGEKRIGLALADGETKLALPFCTVSDLNALIKLVVKENVDVLVIGNPQKMSGAKADNPGFLSFLDRLKTLVDKEIVVIDERLSSKAADALAGGRKDKASRDEIAAALILQSYLDQQA